MSFSLGLLGVLFCIGSFVPCAGCLGFFVDFGAIGAGALGVMKARNTGTGMGLSIAGIALGVVNLVMTAIVTILAIVVGA
jgi:hypothetical protein